MFTPVQFAERADDALRLLSGGGRTRGRHETLRATLDWSYDLLTQEQRLVLARLAVFAGGLDSKPPKAPLAAGMALPPQPSCPLSQSWLRSRSWSQSQRFRSRAIACSSRYASTRASGWRLPASTRHANACTRSCMPPGRRPPNRPFGVRIDGVGWIAWPQTRTVSGRLSVEPPARRRECGKSAGGSGGAPVVLGASRRIERRVRVGGGALARAPGADPRLTARALYCCCELAWQMGETRLARERAEEATSIFRALDEPLLLAYALQSLPMTNGHPRATANQDESMAPVLKCGRRVGSRGARRRRGRHACPLQRSRGK